MKKNIIIISIIFLTIPLISFAALFNNLTGLIKVFIGIINQAIVVVASLALLFFFWGLANFILNSSNAEKKGEGRSIMIWGIVALFVMFSVWGLIGVLQNTFLKGGATSSQSLPSLSPSGLNQLSPGPDSSGYIINKPPSSSDLLKDINQKNTNSTNLKSLPSLSPGSLDQLSQ